MDNDNGMKTTLPFIIGRKRIMPTALFIIHSSLFVSPAGAQTWNEGYLNQPQNLRYESMSPTRLSYNTTKDFAVASAGYQLAKGDFHALDASGDAHNLSAYLGGLRQIGHFSLAGHLGYSNLKENNQSWNSTLWNLRDNPYVLCDSVPGDATTESFDMGAAASYDFSPRLTAGIEIGLRTGSRADQTNPRPKTVTSMLPVTIGADYRLSDLVTIGLAAGIETGSSTIEYTYTNTLKNFRYFLMKGMGDYAKRSSGDESGYKRDYQTTAYRAAVNATWQTADSRWADFIEVSYDLTKQKANDGSTSYSFNGGDYEQTLFSLLNRLQWRPNARLRHNLTLNAALQTGKGTWYDQKRELDMEHGNLVYYRVLSKSINHKNQRLTAALQYQLDILDHNGRRDITAKAGVGYESTTHKQLLGYASPKQEIQALDLSLEVGKALYINKVTLLAQLNCGFRTPQKQTYASGCIYTDDENIDAVYTRPVFEYETAKSWRIGALVDASLPVSRQLTAGLYAKCRYQAYNGKNEYWQGFDGSHLTTADFGAYLKF